MYQALLMGVAVALESAGVGRGAAVSTGLCSVRRHVAMTARSSVPRRLWTSWIRASTIGSSGWLLSASRLPWRNCPEMFYIRLGTAGMRRPVP